MPALVKYERKPLTMAQIYAVRDYIARKRRRREPEKTNGVVTNGTNQNSDGTEHTNENWENCAAKGTVTVTPSPPTAKEIREEKQRCLTEISEELSQLEKTLEELKQKKHGLFEELKSLLSIEKEKKKAAEEKERQLHGFPSPFMSQLTGAGQLMTVSPPFKHSLGLAGTKRPKSPSPPIVQIYSTNSQPPLYPMSQASPGLTRPHHPAHNSIGDVQRSLFQPMNNKVPGPHENIAGYQYQQNFTARDPRYPLHGPQVNPHTPSSPQGQGTHFTSQEREFIDQRHDRHAPSFNHPQGSAISSVGAAGHGLGLQNHSRQPVMNQPSFGQQNMLTGQQQNQANISDGLGGFNQFNKERGGFPSSAGTHRPQAPIKRGNHSSNRSRYY